MGCPFAMWVHRAMPTSIRGPQVLLSGAVVGRAPEVLSSHEVVVNIGGADGVGMSSRFLIYAPGEEITDPDTGESLGVLEVVRGRGEAKHVQDKITTVRSSERRRERQDRVRPRLISPVERMGMMLPRETEIVTEEVEVEAPFVGVKTGDLVRGLP